MLASKFCVVVNKCPMFNREQMPNIQLKFASSRLLCSLRCYNSRFILYCPVFNREQMPNIQLEFAFSRLLRSLRCYNSRFMLCSPMFVRKLACEHANSIVPLCSLKNAPDRILVLSRTNNFNYPRCHLEFTIKLVRLAGYQHIPGK